MVRATALATLVSLATGCPLPPPSASPSSNRAPLSARALAQRESLRIVWYRGNPLPSRPTELEMRQARARLSEAASHERDLLVKLYPDDAEMWALALRDSDGDGINDYRISDVLGKLLEGDTDLDGDGVNNYADSEPFKPSALPAPVGLPAWLDWSRSSQMDGEVASIQREIFERYGILLVERDARFNLPLARAVRDALLLLVKPGGLSTLRVIATETSSLLDPEHPEGVGDFAQMFGGSATLVVYQLGIVAEPIIQLGLLVHEITHSIQAAMDFDADTLARGDPGAPSHLLELLGRFGWSIQLVPATADQVFVLYQPQYTGAAGFTAVWRGRSHEEWLALLDDVSLDDDEARALHIIGTYALSNPSEWYADHVISYVYIALIDSLRGGCAADGFKLLEAWLEETVSDAWPEYAYANARGSPFQRELTRRFPIEDSVRSRLARRYLSPGRFCAARSSAVGR